MESHGPAPGEELNPGEATKPRLASTVILLRGGAEALEVLLAQRTPKARFMGGAWVFPGGGVGPEDGEGQVGHRAAAVRELREEAGITLPDPAALVPFARWITPAEIKIRFDTWFYLAPAPDGAEPEIDGEEVVDYRWSTPADALAAGAAGEIFLVFPTIKQLEQLAGFASARELIEYAAGREVVAVQPRVVGEGEQARVALPGDPEYDA